MRRGERRWADSNRLSWSSSATGIVTISNAAGSKGNATGVAVGDTVITASGSANGKTFSATSDLTVTSP